MIDLDRIGALIRARCADALTDDELSEIEARLAERPVVMLSGEQAEKLVAALDQLETRVGQTIASAVAYREAADAAAAFIDAAAIDTTWN